MEPVGQIIAYKTVLRVRKTADFASRVYFGGNDPPVAKLLQVFGECGVESAGQTALLE